ncbi:uncharacterized protein LOC127634920 [Xyrauchen texanus]|uniref:uncharacterized protein LOC127634920 n=1 Tax=Xyrauchen texanus TaxID=154827 RepID=UPI002241F56E|nr:uncharacterized protein LOC127634920 [Xyrauchen texanus]
MLIDRPMRIMFSQRDATLRKTGIGNIFIKGLSKSINSQALQETFSSFGDILSCKVVCNKNGSKVYGYVHFSTYEAAELAIRKLNGMMLNDQIVSICHYKLFEERQVERMSSSETRNQDHQRQYPGVSLYVSNLPYNMHDEQLRTAFSPFGTVISSKVMMENGRSKGFGFVAFLSAETATKAAEKMNGRVVGGRFLRVVLSRHNQGKSRPGNNEHENESPPPALRPTPPDVPSGQFVATVPQVPDSTSVCAVNQLVQLQTNSRQAAVGVLPQGESLRPLISAALVDVLNSELPRLLISETLDFKVNEVVSSFDTCQTIEATLTSQSKHHPRRQLALPALSPDPQVNEVVSLFDACQTIEATLASQVQNQRHPILQLALPAPSPAPQVPDSVCVWHTTKVPQLQPSSRQAAVGVLPQGKRLHPLISAALVDGFNTELPRLLISITLDFKVNEVMSFFDACQTIEATLTSQAQNQGHPRRQLALPAPSSDPQVLDSMSVSPVNQLAQIQRSSQWAAAGVQPRGESLRPLISAALVDVLNSELPRLLISETLDFKVNQVASFFDACQTFEATLMSQVQNQHHPRRQLALPAPSPDPQVHNSVCVWHTTKVPQLQPSSRQAAVGVLPQGENLHPLISAVQSDVFNFKLAHLLLSVTLDYKVNEAMLLFDTCQTIKATLTSQNQRHPRHQLALPGPSPDPQVNEVMLLFDQFQTIKATLMSPNKRYPRRQLALPGPSPDPQVNKVMLLFDHCQTIKATLTSPNKRYPRRQLALPGPSPDPQVPNSVCVWHTTKLPQVPSSSRQAAVGVLPQGERLHPVISAALLDGLNSELPRLLISVPFNCNVNEVILFDHRQTTEANLTSDDLNQRHHRHQIALPAPSPVQATEDVLNNSADSTDDVQKSTIHSQSSQPTRPVSTKFLEKLSALHLASQTLHITPDDADDFKKSGIMRAVPEQQQSKDSSTSPLLGGWLIKSLESTFTSGLSCPTSWTILSLYALRRMKSRIMS